MRITREDVLHIARLAELAVDDAEVERLARQLDDIVGYVAQLDALPSEPGTELFHPGPRELAWRADEVRPEPLAISPAELAPEFRNGFFVVPRLTGMEDA
jgi:aspartyl-tRNA(Asn)/glutamyl-tRNA(Gln) amidotransferase subunit C